MLTSSQVQGQRGDDASALAEHRAYVYHSGVLEMLRSAIPAAGKEGFEFNDGNATSCYAQLVISILSMDGEEA